MSTLADVTLLELRTELLTEFGHTSSSPFVTEVDSKLNHALLLLHARYPFWRWLLHAFAINVESQITLTGVSWSTSSVSVTHASFVYSGLRRVIRLAGDANEYIIATQPGTTSVTLDRPPVTSGSNSTATVLHAYIELPANFSHMHILRSPQVRRFRRIRHKNPWTFENIQTKEVQPSTADQAAWYTVLMDPIGTEPNRQYLTIYPRLTALTRLTGLYYRAADDLTSNTDIAPVPRFYRRVLFYKAAELLAAKLRDWEAVQYYAAQVEAIVSNSKIFDRFADDSDDTVSNDIDEPLAFPRDNFVTTT